MLKEYRQLYKDNIEDLKILDLDRNELIREYVESGREEFLSAAIYKFWYILINKIAGNKNNRFIESEEFYSMFIDSVLDTCSNALWTDPNHSLYGDDKAPEKSINTIFNSKIINYFHACNRQKRKSSYEKVSLTEYTPVTSAPRNIEENLEMERIDSIIITFFNNKDYYSAYILDMIVNNNTFDESGSIFTF